MSPLVTLASMTRLLYFALLTILWTRVSAQVPFSMSPLDTYFDSLAHYQQGMGTLSIFKGSTELYTRSVGYTDPGMSVLTTPDYVYRVGSITKTFTAVIIHRLALDGKLSLDDKLAKYYPNLPNADQISLDQMLRHQSGLFNYTMAADVEDWIGKPQTPEQHLSRIKSLGTNFAPGEAVEYSNTNFLLLGYIAEQVSGQPYRQLLRDYVVEPCGLANTYVGANTISADRKEVVSFSWNGEAWETADAWDLSNAGAAGNISSTANDLSRFYRKLVRGELLPEVQTKEMRTLRDGLGQGLLALPFGNSTGYGHNGGIEGFSTMSLHFPEEDITLTYLSNGVRLEFNDILISALSVAFNVPFEVPNLRPAPPLAEAEVKAYVGYYKADGFPLDIDISFENGRLIAQATGQGPIPLKPEGEHTFSYQAAGLKLVFTPQAGTMRLQQMGNDVVFVRE